jgi:wyosine [tRNA(Phe)-imidazoG37] synthetase (radical SAM superfamily)
MRKHVYGPINSRRLGKSLGVDLIVPKICPLDCIYCEARATTELTMERREYVSIDEVLAEIDQVLSEIPMPDYITFSGAGEPTLNSGIGRVIEYLKKNYPQSKVCLLTNGLLLNDKSLQQELALLDTIIPSLDASNEAEYLKINRPVPGETLEKLVEGIADFHRNYPKIFMALEMFIAPGINDSDDSLKRFTELVKKISPDALQLNTLARPGVIADLTPADPQTMKKFAEVLNKTVPVTFISGVAKN